MPPDGLATLLDLARAAEAAGDWDTALVHLDEALAQARATEDAKGTSLVLRSIARVHFDRGNLQAAGECYEAALGVARSHGHGRDVASALNGLAVVAQFRGQLEVAERLFVEAGTEADALGDDQLSALVSQNVGMLANMRGQAALALQRYGSALERLRRLGDDRARAFVRELAREYGDQLEPFWVSPLICPDCNPLLAGHFALVDNGFFVHIPKGVEAPEAVHLIMEAGEPSSVVAPRVLLVAEAGARFGGVAITQYRDAEDFVGDSEASALLTRPQRFPWTIENIDSWI